MRPMLVVLMSSAVVLAVSACDDNDTGPDADADVDVDADSDADGDGANDGDVDPEPERLFSFALFTDIHIGEGHGDYGSPGFDDDDGGGDEDDVTELIRTAVAKVNTNAESYDIAFALILGDLTDSGELSEFRRGKEIFDVLEVPYFPLLGNHDMWPYTDSEEAAGPTGDRAFDSIYADHLEAAGAHVENFLRAPSPVHNPEHDMDSHFINYAFDYLGSHFIALDFTTRHHTPNDEPGVNSRAQLHDFDGGTWDWFADRMASYDVLEDNSVFVLSHHEPGIVVEMLDCFTREEHAAIGDFIRDGGYGDAIFGFFAGHRHLSYSYEDFEGQQVVVISAAKETSEVRVVQVYVDGTVSFDTTL